MIASKTTRMSVAVAVCAVAIAGGMSAPTAQAAPVVPVPASPVTHLTGPALTPRAVGVGNFATDLVWFGSTPNPNQSPPRTLFSIRPLTLLPGFVRPFFSWFESLNLSLCIAGVGVHVSAYGTVSATVARNC